MSSFGTIPLKDVQAMLAACAAGHVLKGHGDHYYLVAYNGKTFPSLPRGEHGKSNPGIQKGVVKRMARLLGILECALTYLGLN